MRARIATLTVGATMTIIAVAFAACVYDDPIARVTPADSGTDADAAPDGPLVCPQADDGPLMVSLGNFCIDTTEVTKGQYKAWLLTNPDPFKQDKICRENTLGFHGTGAAGELTLKTKGTLPSTDTDALNRNCFPGTDVVSLETAFLERPVVCLNWCDGYAYCKAQGKRLCGRIGEGSDGEPDAGTLNDPAISQWYSACSGRPPSNFPYGGDADMFACNGKDQEAGGTVPVGSLSRCHGKGPPPFGAIYDMSGNVLEWTDSCLPALSPMAAACQLRGGYFKSALPELACADLRYAFERGRFDDHIGFRCCYP